MLWRYFSRLVSLQPVTLTLMRVATWLDRPLLKLSGGRLRLSFVIPVLLLRCPGARTGLVREVPLLYVPLSSADELPQRVLLVASNGGQRRAPGWYYNLLATETLWGLTNRKWVEYRWRVLADAEYQQAWEQAVALYPGYAVYARRSSRLIPLIELCALES